MKVVEKIPEMRNILGEIRKKGLSIGFVPTMGFLHQGHLSLVKAARQENDFVVVSIFVNPIQFGVGEDYEEYPRDLERDQALASAEGCDLIFSPTVNEMYPPGYSTFVDVQGLTDSLCGAHRPGHFRGVTTVVAKLFSLVSPQRVYFGQKDGQQALVLKKMVTDLNMNLEFHILPTVREQDGLAMSSRNKYLTPEQRRHAPVLYKSLQEAKKRIEQGERRAKTIKQLMLEMIDTVDGSKVDYVEIVETKNLQPVETLEGECLVALAVRLGNTRLIDNILVEV